MENLINYELERSSSDDVTENDCESESDNE